MGPQRQGTPIQPHKPANRVEGQADSNFSKRRAERTKGFLERKKNSGGALRTWWKGLLSPSSVRVEKMEVG